MALGEKAVEQAAEEAEKLRVKLVADAKALLHDAVQQAERNRLATNTLEATVGELVQEVHAWRQGWRRLAAMLADSDGELSSEQVRDLLRAAASDAGAAPTA